MGTDRVCWKTEADYCVDNVELFEAIQYNSTYTPPLTHNFAGFLGLSPKAHEGGWADAPSFVERLFDERWIDKRAVTLWFRYGHAGSGLIFGNNNNTGFYRGDVFEKNFTTIMIDNFTNEQPPKIFALKLSNVWYFNGYLSNVMNETSYAVIDSVLPDMWMPREHFA